MKTTLYLLIGIFIFGIVASGFAHKTNPKYSILIEPVDNNISPAVLARSAEIISERLKTYSTDKFDINVIPEHNRIQVIFGTDSNLKVAEKLLLQKGTLEFYETYNLQEFSELTNSNNALFSLLSSNNNSPVVIGCTSVSDFNKVNGWLNSPESDKRVKFAWGRIHENNEICLYALKTDSTRGVLLSGSDVDTIHIFHEQNSNIPGLTIRFKQSAAAFWSEATKRDMGHAIAIVLDGNVIFAPIVKSEITDGICQITGDFTEDQVRYIAAIAGCGELPVGFKIVQ
jgi:SecD/SecF fusion protein